MHKLLKKICRTIFCTRQKTIARLYLRRTLVLSERKQQGKEAIVKLNILLTRDCFRLVH